ncbi:hypothetical protein [Mycobacterium paraterrae]|uniref:Proline rich protein n=1 Tax=Mycobacterium paraterrae TaxID=577492 RepID=A0ABY3VKP6_9MYCO|nr:hypothetical protein [Mycobacterium paraterrae]UMB69989.1 hypothetical protein MKK62_01105 [Mycobacterium paraterrae]
MSETPDTPTTPTTVATEPATAVVKPYWLYRFAAWVVIVAGIVFTVTTIFFAGFKVAHLGHHRCHHHGWGHHHSMNQDGPQHHGQGVGFQHGFGGPGPSHLPGSVAPSLAPAHS